MSNEKEGRSHFMREMRCFGLAVVSLACLLLSGLRQLVVGTVLSVVLLLCEPVVLSYLLCRDILEKVINAFFQHN